MPLSPAKHFPLFLAVASVALFYAFGLFHLGKFETVDEHFWKYERLPQYWNALADGKWKKTYINDKPGVSVALISGSGLLFADPTTHRVRDTAATLDGSLTVYDISQTEHIDIALRLPLLLFNSALLLLIFFAIRRAFDDALLAALAVSLTALSPILLGISQIINPDTLLWSFSATAFFSYFAFLKTEEKKILVLAALAAGGALLSKYTGNILYPLLFALFLGHLLVTADHILARETLAAYVRRHLISLLILLAGSFTIFAIGLPAVFVKPEILWENTFGFWQKMHILLPFVLLFAVILCDTLYNRARLTEVCIHFVKHRLPTLLRFSLILPLFFFGSTVLFGLGNQSVVPLEQLANTAKIDGALAFPLLEHTPALSAVPQKLFAEAYPFVFSLPPVILFLVLFLWIYILAGRRIPPDTLLLTSLLSVFAVAYFGVALAAGVLANVRYSIILYPLFAFLAALGVREIIGLFPEHRRVLVSGILLALVFATLITGLFHSRPFYFNYVSPLLDKKFAPHDGWGYGLYEAAEYLNALPEARDAFVWSDRNGLCQFLSGPRCVSGYKIDIVKTPPRYFVISARGIARGYVPRDKATGTVLIDYTAIQQDALWRLDIGGRLDNFVLVLPAVQ